MSANEPTRLETLDKLLKINQDWWTLHGREIESLPLEDAISKYPLVTIICLVRRQLRFNKDDDLSATGYPLYLTERDQARLFYKNIPKEELPQWEKKRRKLYNEKGCTSENVAHCEVLNELLHGTELIERPGVVG